MKRLTALLCPLFATLALILPHGVLETTAVAATIITGALWFYSVWSRPYWQPPKKG